MNHSTHGTPLKMPERLPGDGPISVDRLDDESIRVEVMTNGETRSIVMSPYNAWRAFWMLSLFLGIKLPSKLGKMIKFGGDVKAVIR